MPLQNRVDPFGVIHAHPARGLFMGNRGGMIHEPATRTLTKRRWASKAWIICLCAFKGRRRTLMGPASYTELFFLDEATALAAGHRPCFECRRADARHFADLFARSNDLPAPSAPDIDRTLHAARRAVHPEVTDTHEEAFNALPDGTMVSADGNAWLRSGGKAWRWSFDGYTPGDIDAGRIVTVLTPRPTVAALRAGYRPVIHESANGATA